MRRAWMVIALGGLVGAAALAQVPATPTAPAEERVSPLEREQRIKGQVSKMKDLQGQIDKIGTQARNERDIVKLNCVNEKLAQVRGLVRVSEGAAGELRDAAARRDDDDAQHALTKSTIAASKVSQLRQEAEQCIGQLAYFNDEKTVVEMETPPGLTETDPTLVPVPPGVINRAPPGSGF